jgi:hypothetical protein
MKTTKKKQVGFYAEQNVDEFLQSLDSGIRTKTINSLIQKHISLLNRPLLKFNCAFCRSQVNGKIEYVGADPKFVDDPTAERQYEEGQQVYVLVRCPHSMCKKTSLIQEIEMSEDWNDWCEYKRLYPAEETVEGSTVVESNMSRAVSAFYNSDYTAVALYCRRTIEQLCDHFMPDAKMMPLSKRIKDMEDLGYFDSRLTRWANLIINNANHVLHDSTETLGSSDANNMISFTREIARNLLILRKSEIAYQKSVLRDRTADN